MNIRRLAVLVLVTATIPLSPVNAGESVQNATQNTNATLNEFRRYEEDVNRTYTEDRTLNSVHTGRNTSLNLGFIGGGANAHVNTGGDSRTVSQSCAVQIPSASSASNFLGLFARASSRPGSMTPEMRAIFSACMVETNQVASLLATPEFALETARGIILMMRNGVFESLPSKGMYQRFIRLIVEGEEMSDQDKKSIVSEIQTWYLMSGYVQNR